MVSKLSQRSFFERIQGAIIFFRDLLTLNQNQQIFQTIAMSHDLLESRNEVKFSCFKNKSSRFNFHTTKKCSFVTFLENLFAISSLDGSYANTKT